MVRALRPHQFVSEPRIIVAEIAATKFLGELRSIDLENVSLTADLTVKRFKAEAEFVLEVARYINPTGLAADGTNFMNIKVVETAVVMANWSTETGQEGTIAADTFVDLTLGTLADRTLAADEVLSVFYDEGGSVTLPVGLLTLEGRYFETSPTAIKLFEATRRFLVEQVKYINPTGLAADATNFFDIQLKNGSTVLANWSTETGQEGTIAADTWVDLTLSSTDSDLILAAGDVLLLNLAEDGTTTLPAGRIQIEGRYL